MRTQFKGHFQEPQETIDQLWNEATFVFDANVLLNLYRYSDEARAEFLDLLVSIQGRSWLPEQCAYEYLSNRLSVIREQVKSYSTTAEKIKAILGTFAGSMGHPFISGEAFGALQKVVADIENELSSNGKSQEAQLTDDHIKETIANIFAGRVGGEFSEERLKELFAECEARYAEEVPPGYKDKNKHPNPTRISEKRSNFGDFLFWRQTMDWAKAETKDVILVTDDQKEDWWLIVSGKTVSARPELSAEFCEQTDQHILFYNPKSFLKLAKEKLHSKISDDTIIEIQKEHDTRSLALAKEQSGYEKRDRIKSRQVWNLERSLKELRSDLEQGSLLEKPSNKLDRLIADQHGRYESQRRFDMEAELHLIRNERRKLDVAIRRIKDGELDYDLASMRRERDDMLELERELSWELKEFEALGPS